MQIFVKNEVLEERKEIYLLEYGSRIIENSFLWLKICRATAELEIYDGPAEEGKDTEHSFF